MFKRVYTVLHVLKAGGFEHEVVWLQSSGLFIDFSRDHGMRIRGALTRHFDDGRTRIQLIAGALFSDQEIIARAYRLATIRTYDIVRYNCEHFVRELIGAELASPQIRAGGIAAGAFILAIAATRLAAQ